MGDSVKKKKKMAGTKSRGVVEGEKTQEASTRYSVSLFGNLVLTNQL